MGPDAHQAEAGETLPRTEMQRDSERQQTRQGEEQRHASNDSGATSSGRLSPASNLRRSNCVLKHLESRLRHSKRVIDLD